MKIEKEKLSKALKQIGIFVGKNGIDKNVSLVHFRNENKKAMLFATDFASTGRAYFDTDEEGLFEFCIEYDQLLQTARVRGKEITATIDIAKKNENGETISGIEFADGKSTFNWALRDNNSLKSHEDAAVVPADSPCFAIDAKTLKNAIKESGFARNERDTQTPFVTGVNFTADNDLSMVSTDRHRVAGWKRPNPETLEGMTVSDVSGILSPKTIASIGLYDDNEKIRVYITDSQIILVSNSLEAYASKIMCDFPNVQQMFDKPVISEYELSAKDLKESIEIVLGKENSIQMDFCEGSVTISCSNMTGDGNSDDTFPCTRISGGDEAIMVKPSDILDIVKNTFEDKIVISFREMGNGFKMLSYTMEDGAYGIIAPMKK